MELHWHRPKYSMHGDMVEMVAPCGRYLIEFGMNPSGGYYVACCDHIQEENCRQWEAVLPTAEEAKDYAQWRVEAEAWWVNDNQIFIELCGDPGCAVAACVQRAAERRLEQKLDAVFSEYGC